MRTHSTMEPSFSANTMEGMETIFRFMTTGTAAQVMADPTASWVI